MDGKFDITGANQEGNGKIDGATVNFDIDPSKQSGNVTHLVTDLVGMKVERVVYVHHCQMERRFIIQVKQRSLSKGCLERQSR